MMPPLTFEIIVRSPGGARGLLFVSLKYLEIRLLGGTLLCAKLRVSVCLVRLPCTGLTRACLGLN